MMPRRLLVTLGIALLLSAAAAPVWAACATDSPCPLMGAMMMKIHRSAAEPGGALTPFMACCQRAPAPAVAPAPGAVTAPELAFATPASSPLDDAVIAAADSRPVAAGADGLERAQRRRDVGLCVLNAVFRI